MAHALKQHGNNSVTYSFVLDGDGDPVLTATDWEVLPNSRIKTVLLRTFPFTDGPTELAAREAFWDALGAEGATVVITVPYSSGGPEVFPNVESLTDVGPVNINYEGLPWAPGTRGVLRISLAYSASE